MENKTNNIFDLFEYKTNYIEASIRGIITGIAIYNLTKPTSTIETLLTLAIPTIVSLIKEKSLISSIDENTEKITRQLIPYKQDGVNHRNYELEEKVYERFLEEFKYLPNPLKKIILIDFHEREIKELDTNRPTY